MKKLFKLFGLTTVGLVAILLALAGYMYFVQPVPNGEGIYSDSDLSVLDHDSERKLIGLVALGHNASKYNFVAHARVISEGKLAIIPTRAGMLKGEREKMLVAAKELHYLYSLLSDRGLDAAVYTPVGGDILYEFNAAATIQHHLDTRSLASPQNALQVVGLAMRAKVPGMMAGDAPLPRKLTQQQLLDISSRTEKFLYDRVMPGLEVSGMENRPDLVLEAALAYVNDYSMSYYGFAPYEVSTSKALSAKSYEVGITGPGREYMAYLLENGSAKEYLDYLQKLTQVTYAWITSQTDSRPDANLYFRSQQGGIYFKIKLSQKTGS